MRIKSIFIYMIIFLIILFFICFIYLKENVETFNIQVKQNIERNLSMDWGPNEPKLSAEGYSSDILNLSLNFNKFIIEIPMHEKSHILNLTKRIVLDECIFKLNLLHLLLDLDCRKFTTSSKNLTFDQNKHIIYSKDFFFDSDIFQRLFTRFRFFNLKFYFNQVSINNDFIQNVNGQLKFYNDENATLTINDRLIEFFNRPEGLEIHHQNQKFYFLNKNFFQHFWN
ncbi:MAG: hypothetical protein HN867_14310 [Deltaproteobacteria bacterium]|nr:hypothetical protein [Deltaproteobacteria bacterium]